MSSDLYSRPNWISPSLWSLSEFLQITSLLPSFKTMRIAILLVWHFVAWSVSFWPLCNCFFWTVLYHYTVGPHKIFIRNHPTKSTIKFTVCMLLGTWFPIFHSVLFMWTHGKNVSQPSKPRIAGLLGSCCFVFILWSSWVMSLSFPRRRARIAAHHKQQVSLSMYLGAGG